MFSQNTDKTKTARMISTAIQSIHKINHWSQKFCTFCVVFCICIIKPVQNLTGRWKGVIGFLFQQSCFATFELDRTVQPLQRLENVMWVKESMHGRYEKPFVGKRHQFLVINQVSQHFHELMRVYCRELRSKITKFAYFLGLFHGIYV